MVRTVRRRRQAKHRTQRNSHFQQNCIREKGLFLLPDLVYVEVGRTCSQFRKPKRFAHRQLRSHNHVWQG